MIEGFVIFGIIIAVTGGLGYGAWIVYKSQRPNVTQEERIWQRLAKSQKLNFTPGGYLDDTFVSGTYRGHFLMLRTLQKETDIYTLISLNRQKSSEDEVKGNILGNLVDLTKSQQLQGNLQVEENGNRIYYESRGVEIDIDYIRSIFNLLHTLISIYPQIVNLGGEAVPVLEEVTQDFEEFRQVCTQMVRGISQETTDRLGDQVSELWCPKCLTRFAAIDVNLPQTNRITYYGCRGCGQSERFLQLKISVVAVLNNQDLTEQIQQDGRLKVNWLSRREMFDFERVEIVQAADEEVERFAVQVGNDTDEDRCHRYKEMICEINCQLSANTIRILQSIFGDVRVQNFKRHSQS